ANKKRSTQKLHVRCYIQELTLPSVLLHVKFSDAYSMQFVCFRTITLFRHDDYDSVFLLRNKGFSFTPYASILLILCISNHADSLYLTFYHCEYTFPCAARSPVTQRRPNAKTIGTYWLEALTGGASDFRERL